MEEEVDNQVKVPTKQHPQLPILELGGNCLKVISSHGCGHQPNNNFMVLTNLSSLPFASFHTFRNSISTRSGLDESIPLSFILLVKLFKNLMHTVIKTLHVSMKVLNEN